MSTHDPLRLFFAIELNNELRTALSKLIDDLKQEPWGHRVRWVHPENLQVTLRFLGDVNPALIEKLAEGAHQAIKNITPFELQFGNIRFFPSPTAPRAITADIISISELFDLAHSLEKVAGSLGFPPETKPYLPHLTLGRIVHQHTSNLREGLQLTSKPMSVGEIVLFNSEKTEYSQTYTPLERISLQTATAQV